MTFLLFLFGCALAAGLFFITADILKLPGSPPKRRFSPLARRSPSG
jgi:hypothetical protein